MLCAVPVALRCGVCAVGYDGGFAVADGGEVYMQSGKYLDNLLAMPAVLVLFVCGALMLVLGVVATLRRKGFRRGIWLAGPGTLFAVMALFMIAG